MMHFGENKQYKHKSQHRAAPGTDMFCGCRHGQCHVILKTNKQTKQNISLRIVMLMNFMQCIIAEVTPQQTESLDRGSFALRRTSFSRFSRCFSSFSWAFRMSFSFFLMVERSL